MAGSTLKLTGKCKEAFDEWFVKVGVWQIDIQGLTYMPTVYWPWEEGLKEFYKSFTLSMQYGIYQDFFDSVDIDCEVSRVIDDENISFFVTQTFDMTFSERSEARTESINRANKLYNKFK
jgi:hypothetical protein